MGHAVNGAPAAVLMDRMYRHQRHIYDFSRKYYLLGRDRLIERLAPPPGGAVLEIGCGTGRNLIAAARRYPAARFYGLDISAAMLTTARNHIARRGLSSHICVIQADACALDPSVHFGRTRFDRIFISYSLSMIPAWRDVVAGVPRLLTPNGQVHIVDFGGQDGLPRWLRQGLRRWLALFEVRPCDDLADALRAIATNANLCVSIESLYRGYARYALMRTAF
ncbi:MAG TPA: class I SAM-dependent methyltransferase [Vineibacter sp.]|nr:class I SAM-dependent methyltransferase [Vineibacter sp.]